VYGAWAPEGSAWSDWVKPVTFACLPEEVEPEPAEMWRKWRDVARWCAGDFAVVVDLRGADGVALGVALAHEGYQPVPLYNALPHARGLVDVGGVMQALVDGARQLPPLPLSAPPAFLVDASRMLAAPGSSRVAGYDNRSVVRATDFPSARKLSAARIRRALWIRSTGERPAPDLAAVLSEWQKHGLELWRLATNDAGPPQPYVLEPRPWYARAFRWLVSAEPHARSDGAYGRFTPQGG